MTNCEGRGGKAGCRSEERGQGERDAEEVDSVADVRDWEVEVFAGVRREEELRGHVRGI